MNKLCLTILLVFSTTSLVAAQGLKKKSARSKTKVESTIIKSDTFKKLCKHLENERDEEALALTSQLLKDYPNDILGVSNIHFIEGNIKYKQGNYNNAIISYKKARDLMVSRDVRAHFQDAVDRTLFRIQQDEEDKEKQAISKKNDTLTSDDVAKSGNKKDEQPFAVIENVPVYPGCENEPNNEQRKSCMSSKISSLINYNFNTKLAKHLNLRGRQRTNVQFTINKEGLITNIVANGNQPNLELEALRVLALIPKMEAGMQRGKPVSVIYSLPLFFMIEP